jgi:diguanylate cyclase (GGDEF)-like protein
MTGALLVVASLLLLAAAGYGVHRARLRRVQALQRALEAEVVERTAELHQLNDQLRRANRRLAELSRTDPLTGLGNRRYLAERIGRDLAQLARLRLAAPASDVAILFLLADIDHFKRINDTHGHGAGDLVLAEVGRRLAARVRASDYAVRWGGEEFLVVACFTPAAAAPRVAERLLAGVFDEPFPLAPGDEPLTVTGSIGFAALPFGAAGDATGDGAADPGAPHAAVPAWESAVAIADHALRVAKARGRDGWAGIVPGATAAVAGSLDGIARTVGARVERGELAVVAGGRVAAGG